MYANKTWDYRHTNICWEKVPLKSYVTLLVNFALIEIIFKTVQHAKYMLWYKKCTGKLLFHYISPLEDLGSIRMSQSVKKLKITRLKVNMQNRASRKAVDFKCTCANTIWLIKRHAFQTVHLTRLLGQSTTQDN